jgi:hypothetical protein
MPEIWVLLWPLAFLIWVAVADFLSPLYTDCVVKTRLCKRIANTGSLFTKMLLLTIVVVGVCSLVPPGMFRHLLTGTLWRYWVMLWPLTVLLIFVSGYIFFPFLYADYPLLKQRRRSVDEAPFKIAIRDACFTVF